MVYLNNIMYSWIYVCMSCPGEVMWHLWCQVMLGWRWICEVEKCGLWQKEKRWTLLQVRSCRENGIPNWRESSLVGRVASPVAELSHKQELTGERKRLKLLIFKILKSILTIILFSEIDENIVFWYISNIRRKKKVWKISIIEVSKYQTMKTLNFAQRLKLTENLMIDWNDILKREFLRLKRNTFCTLKIKKTEIIQVERVKSLNIVTGFTGIKK